MRIPWRKIFLLTGLLFCTFQLLLTAHVFAAPPQPPDDVQASDGVYPDKATISWTASTGATGYDIYRASLPVSMGGIITKIGSSTAESYDDTTIPCDGIYHYWVKAKNASGSSKYSEYNTGYCAGSATFSLSHAVDNTLLSFETGGQADWFWQNSRYHKLNDAAESADISDSQESWMQTTVTGPGIVEFYWKVSSQANHDFLEFYIDGTQNDSISGTVHWTLKKAELLPGSHTLKWRYTKDATFSGGFDCGWVDFITWTPDTVTIQIDPPAMPANISATDGTFTDKIRITWNASPRALTYEIFRAASFDGQRIKIGTTAKQFFDDTDIPCGPGNTFYYWVKAVNSAGASDLFYSDLGHKSCPFTPEPTAEIINQNTDSTAAPSAVIEEPMVLEAPDNVSATDGMFPEKVRITWSAIPGATSYEVYRHSDCCGKRTKIATTADTFFEDTAELSTIVNYYWVKAVNANTISVYSNYDSGHKLLIPLPPVNLDASDGEHISRVHLTWEPAKRPESDLSCENTCGGDEIVEKIDEYEIYRADWSGGAKIKIGTTANTWFDDYDIPCDSCGYVYYYWVKAKNAAGTSHYSEFDTGYAYITLRDPSDISATDGTIHHCVRISWSPIEGAVSYNVFRSDTFDGIKTKIGTVGPPCCDNSPRCTNFLDVTPVCPEIYYYWVQSVDKNGISSCSFLYYDTGFCSGD